MEAKLILNFRSLLHRAKFSIALRARFIFQRVITLCSWGMHKMSRFQRSFRYIKFLLAIHARLFFLSCNQIMRILNNKTSIYICLTSHFLMDKFHMTNFTWFYMACFQIVLMDKLQLPFIWYSDEELNKIDTPNCLEFFTFWS